ncbi:MAG: precorrin-6y C5,15-methyltransferase (decarboxylating) subunit CbiE [Desulfovibrio sp.]|jgi:precorrin-6Y C5,15-methyltransferase (decarboxylating)|nr:precorrin-6y C5,15-methyltransferase (decarboxylating) subunit CbiE [Desulfovibrio sp.]
MPSTAIVEYPAGFSKGESVPVYILGLGLPLPVENRSFSFKHMMNHPVLASADVIIGGKTQLAGFVDHPAEKLFIGADSLSLYERIEANRRKGQRQVVLCGGDPLFFGLGARLAERFAPGTLRILPGIGSLQAAAAFLSMAWENVEAVSLHGRNSRLPLAHALIRAASGGCSIFLLTDSASSPASVAAFMQERGHSGYMMHVMGNLHFTPDTGCAGTVYPSSVPAALHTCVQAEYYARLTVEQAISLPAIKKESGPLQLVIWLEPMPPAVRDGGTISWPFGLQDASLAAENALFTKTPVRAVGLGALGIEAGDTVWDLGAGSGAMSVEAARLAHRGRVVAVEARADRIPLLEKNRRRFGAANMEILHGSLPEALDDCLAVSSPPQRIFWGGGLSGNGGEASRSAVEKIFHKAWDALLPGGRMVIHCVLLSSLEFVRAQFSRTGVAAEVSCIQASLSVPLAGDYRLHALNPVFLVSASKPEHSSPSAKGRASSGREHGGTP